MKKTCLVSAAVIGIALAAPVTADHMNQSPMDLDELVGDNFDLMGMHELAYDSLEPSGNIAEMSDMDPADNPSSTQTGSADIEVFPYISSPPTQTQDGTVTSTGR